MCPEVQMWCDVIWCIFHCYDEFSLYFASTNFQNGYLHMLSEYYLFWLQKIIFEGIFCKRKLVFLQ